MRVITAIVLVAAALAGCTDAGSDATEVIEPLLDETGHEWTDQELIGQVDPNFTFDPSLQVQISSVEPWGEPGDVPITGTVSRDAAVFLTLSWGVGTCDFGFTHSPRILANGTWEYTFPDLAMGSYGLTAMAFGRGPDGDLDLTVGDSYTESGSIPEFARGHEATVSIDYGETSDLEPVQDLVWITDFHADPYYATDPDAECSDVKRPGYLNVHDVLVGWEEMHGHVINYSYNADFNSYGVDSIDGHGQGLAGAPPWWCYTVNGSADGVQGITLQRFQPGDRIHWRLGECAGLGLAPDTDE